MLVRLDVVKLGALFAPSTIGLHLVTSLNTGFVP